MKKTNKKRKINKKKILTIVLVIIVIIVIYIAYTMITRKFERFVGLDKNTNYLIIGSDTEKAEEILNNYVFTFPTTNYHIHPDYGFRYYDENHNYLFTISVNDHNECIVSNNKGQKLGYKCKKGISRNKYKVDEAILDLNDSEEKIINDFMNLSESTEEYYTFYDENVYSPYYEKFNPKPSKVVKAEKDYYIDKINEQTGNSYKDVYWYGLAIYEFDSEEQAKIVFDKYTKEIYESGASLNKGAQTEYRVDENNEYYYHLHDRGVSYITALYGTKDNKIFKLNFQISNDTGNKDMAIKYLNFLKEKGYLQSDDMYNYIMNQERWNWVN